ncbi:MAG TPA: hypothetical protein VFZ53_22470 [Polyangiaceae bacterium]
MARSLAVSFLALAVLAAPEVRAQVPASDPKADQARLADAIELKNGAYLRGLILEVDPASHLTIELPTGEVRKIPVGEIASAERSGKPLKFTEPVAPAPGAVAKATAPAPEAKAEQRELDRILSAIRGPRVNLKLESNEEAFLERRIGSKLAEQATGPSALTGTVGYHLVCQVPCDVELPAYDPVVYRIDGDRTEPTEWFRLPRYNARIKADLVSNMWPIWPRAMLVGGTIFSLVGGGMLAGWALADGSDGVRNVGIGLAATGGVFFLASGVLFLTRPHSTYEIERQP